ncbi:MAG: Eco57I restriction-modification methylase domain-containing protein [Promethearchaeota archaeon]
MKKKEVLIENNNSISQFFTPPYVAEFMVRNIFKFLKSKKALSELRVLEPSVGEGIFLKYLLKYGFKNITAYEIDEKFKSYLITKYPEVNFRFENFLGSSIEEKYDLIIGNPPYLGQNYNAELFQEYSKKYPICAKYFIGNMDLFYYFIHMSIEKLVSDGILSFITTNYWITKSQKTGIKYLKSHILDETFLLQYIDLSSIKIFPQAKGQHNCIFILKKKTDDEKLNSDDKSIEVIQVKKNMVKSQPDDIFNRHIFKCLMNNINSPYIVNYYSALKNKDLDKNSSWNLLYSLEVKQIIDYIEKYSIYMGRKVFLKDIFSIRTGIIFPKDEIFILKEGINIKINQNRVYIRIGNSFIKLNKDEIRKLKKIYKSSAIKPFGFNSKNFSGYGIYFNKNEFNVKDKIERNKLLEKKYPNLTLYLKQYEEELKSILKNAKEDPLDFYFPRRGIFLKDKHKGHKCILDLEPFYENSEKIFFKYITDENIFGYAKNQYYATSDTYFLWPKIPERRDEIDYLFILAYLNSKIVSFIFKAKNISIKRSKTKLEYGIPIPSPVYFRSEKDMIILSLIRLLCKNLIKEDHSKFDYSFYKLNCLSHLGFDNIIEEIKNILKQNNQKKIIEKINELFFMLFELDKDLIEKLEKKYY